MRILISNDDGVHAEGIAVLANELSTLAETVIFAPDRNRSGASSSLTLGGPVRVQRLEDKVVSVEGTPTDCVHLAMTGLLKDVPDMVVSGINEGPNLGDDVWYSGTVAAAVEGRYLGLPAIAVSLLEDDDGQCSHYHTAARVVHQLTQRLLVEPLPSDTILNINVPNLPIEQIEGMEVTRLGTRHRAESTVETMDPRGKLAYWIGCSGPEQDAGPGTDFHAVAQNKVSVTPLKIDLTHYKAFAQISEWVSGLEL